MNFRVLLYIAIISLIYTCACSPSSERLANELVNYVDPFIGTDAHGHTFPGATVPFGMVQLSPDTRTLGWDACGGYHYSDSSILGFSHTHLSGTGIGDYGDVLFMPFAGDVSINPGKPDSVDNGYRSRFDRDTEIASPGYYQVQLTDYGINAELTATRRVGVHRYTFPEAEKAGILIDLSHSIHGHENPLHEIEILNKREVRGLKVTKGWAQNHYVYFSAKFDKPFDAEIYSEGKLQEGIQKLSGQDIKVKLKFSTDPQETVIAKVGLSGVSYEGATKNLDQEMTGWSFDTVCRAAADRWEEQLSKVRVETIDESEKRTFYTALYHSFIYPGIYNDVDGTYRGMDQQIYHSDTANYTVFSLWDTHRALHPLFTLLKPEYNQELIRSLLRKYDEGGILPKWELASNYTGTMIGSHAISVIADAYMKGQRDFNTQKALKAAVHAMKYDTVKQIAFPSEGVKSRLMPKAKLFEEKYGFIPADLSGSSVSRALEYAYNYWAIATMASDMGRKEIASEFYEKSKRYRNYFDEEVGFMRAKNLDGSWEKPFHPRYSKHVGSPYVEGNAWQWNWYVPHDVEDLIALMGGKDKFGRKLDSLFTVTSEVLGEEQSVDITGLIGQYAHGNEPSHHIAYLFNWIEKPWRTQEIVTKILDQFYTDQPDGLCGNEDCGQMSAWYVLNAMGFYPVCPGDTRYSIGLPSFDKIELAMDGGTFTIIAENRTPDNPYVQEVFLNGVKLTQPFIDHHAITSGSELKFKMGQEKKVFWN